MKVIFSGERFSHYGFCDLLGLYKPWSRHEGGGESYNLLGICVVVVLVVRGEC